MPSSRGPSRPGIDPVSPASPVSQRILTAKPSHHPVTFQRSHCQIPSHLGLGFNNDSWRAISTVLQLPHVAPPAPSQAEGEHPLKKGVGEFENDIYGSTCVISDL